MTKQILVFAVSLVILVLSCKKEKTSSGSNTNIATEYPGDKPYSGLWSGTVVEKDSLPSLCRFVESNWKVLQKWLVKGDSVFIDETILLNYETLKYNWKGTIKNDTLDILSSRNINCFGIVSLSEVFIKAPITISVDNYNFQTRTIYPMCLPNCIFILNYNMSKTK